MNKRGELGPQESAAEEPDFRLPENAWMFLPPGMPSIEDPEREKIKRILGFYYKVDELEKFQADLAAGMSIDELSANDPWLAVRISEWRSLGLIE